MKFGDLSNKVAPRIIITFEGAVGLLSGDNTKAYDKAVAKGDWHKAIRLFDLNNFMLNKILYLVWKKDFNISFTTSLSSQAADEISDWMSDLSIPISDCFYAKPDELARMLPYNPDVVAVFDPDPWKVLTFGSKARVLYGPDDLDHI